jgi:hypothetical protein
VFISSRALANAARELLSHRRMHPDQSGSLRGATSLSSRAHTRRGVALALSLALGGLAGEAAAQEAQFAGVFEAMSGIEGGGDGYASGVRRARTTLRAGGEMWIDESPEDVVAAAAIIELEPHASIGADLRYTRLVGDFALHAGAIGIIAPNWMIGVTFGAQYRLRVAEMVTIDFGPTGNVYFYGGDLPKSHVLWQGLASAGVRVEF